MSMLSPVRGLRPFRAARRLVENVPNPAMATLSFLASVSEMVEKTALTSRSAVALGRDNCEATFVPRSDLFMDSAP